MEWIPKLRALVVGVGEEGFRRLDSSRCPRVASHRRSGRNLSGKSESPSIGSRLCHVVWGFVTADKMASLSGPEMRFRSHTGHRECGVACQGSSFVVILVETNNCMIRRPVICLWS